ncbi:ferredoxin [Streptomyces sp. NPDC090303]|uniref:ferredoxin n=1 Tax=Streptomyces sp. NPDC090303 TaxID=3365960 RepID=UPI00381CD8BF
MSQGWTVHADRHLCLGSGICASIAPDVFDVRGEYVHVDRHETHEGDQRVLAAAELCPVFAITVRQGPVTIAPGP